VFPCSGRIPQVPKVIVKKEPASPDQPSSVRHRPSRLNLSNMPSGNSGPMSSRPLTSKESGGLALQDIGLACLSPGFNTQDANMREQLERSMDIREQQRRIIEARQKGQKIPGEDVSRNSESGLFKSTGKTPGTSRRKGPPPGLSINAPSHEQFANERVIQSAPLNQTFTGYRQNVQPMTRQVANQPSSLAQTSHIHHVPATQTNNRLPPIADVFPGELNAGGSSTRTLYPHSPGPSVHLPPAPSPSFPPHTAYPASHPPRPREYKSAEEAMASMTGGREDLLPRVVHYGGHQPPTPPSPKGQAIGLGVSTSSGSSSSAVPPPSLSNPRKRDRDEFDAAGSSPPHAFRAGPPLAGPLTAAAPPAPRRGPFGDGTDSPDVVAAKKKRFMRLCEEAWDLFHS